MEGETSVVESDASARESDLAERNGLDSLTYVPTESEWGVSDLFSSEDECDGWLP